MPRRLRYTAESSPNVPDRPVPRAWSRMLAISAMLTMIWPTARSGFTDRGPPVAWRPDGSTGNLPVRPTMTSGLARSRRPGLVSDGPLFVALTNARGGMYDPASRENPLG